jgi:endonuclease YncB( thermonuclease family)
MVEGKTVRLFPGPQSDDDEKSPFAYVVVDNSMVNAKLLETGWAQTPDKPSPHPYGAAFASLMNHAAQLKRGLWAP